VSIANVEEPQQSTPETAASAMVQVHTRIEPSEGPKQRPNQSHWAAEQHAAAADQPPGAQSIIVLEEGRESYWGDLVFCSSL
jgi:hypothetical protein